ncbi:MAG: iron-sulfur cluster assembly protein [Thermoleophilaceae bacterium]
MVTSEQVREVLGSVVDPERGQSVVDLGIVRSVDVADDGRVAVVLAVGAPGSPIRAQYEGVIRDRVSALHGRELGGGRLRPSLRRRRRRRSGSADRRAAYRRGRWRG